MAIAEWKYPFPSRTRKSSALTPMVLQRCGRVGSRQAFFFALLGSLAHRCVASHAAVHQALSSSSLLPLGKASFGGISWRPAHHVRMALAPVLDFSLLFCLEKSNPWTFLPFFLVEGLISGLHRQFGSDSFHHVPLSASSKKNKNADIFAGVNALRNVVEM